MATAAPRIGPCPACGASVLFAPRHAGGELALDPAEVLPRMRCPGCRGPRCGRCSGAGWIGTLEWRGPGRALLFEDGHARPLRDGCQINRQGAEALHLLHDCASAA